MRLSLARRLSDRALWARFAELLGNLHLRRPLKNLYRYFAVPDHGVAVVKAVDRRAKFYVQSPEQAVSLRRLQGEKPMLEHLAAHLSAGDTFLDVGAEIGLYAAFLSQVVGTEGQVVAFEPSIEALEQLQDNLRLNRVGNVSIYTVALSGENGKARLYWGKVGFAPTLRNLHDTVGDFPLSREVEIARGDDFLNRERLPVPTAIKLDVEGAEHAALLGLQSTLRDPRCRAVGCEIHPHELLPPGIATEDIPALLRDAGFEVSVIPRGDTLFALASKKSAPK